MFQRYRIQLAVGAILFALGSGYRALHTTEGIQSVAQGETALDPGAYRGEIVDVEAILFSPAPLIAEDRERLVAALEVLRAALKERGGTHMAAFSARELGTLVGRTRGRGELDGEALAGLRHQWMRIRSNTFHDDASWLRFSENDPVASRDEPRIVLSAGDRALLAEAAATLDRLDQAIARATRDCPRLGEPEVTMDETQGAALARSWEDWRVSWQVEIGNIRTRSPRAPAPDAPAALRFVHGSLDDATRQLEAIATDGRGRWNAPYRQDWERRIQGAAKQVRDARFWIDRAEKGLGV